MSLMRFQWQGGKGCEATGAWRKSVADLALGTVPVGQPHNAAVWTIHLQGCLLMRPSIQSCHGEEELVRKEKRSLLCRAALQELDR